MKIERFRDKFFDGLTRYRWLDTIGRGGMGVVFKAQDLDLDEVVAIKVLSPEIDSGDESDNLVRRFKREINLNRKIKHPNVARIHDFGTSGDYPYITMEYVPGRDLRTLIRQEGRLAPVRAISIIRQIALGTNAAHKLGIVHRDLKPQNVIVDAEGKALVTDFGIARAGVSEITQTGSVMGTPHYLSPEQAQGYEVTSVSDLYSIGVILYEALTGRVPFEGESAVAVAMKQVSQTPQLPSSINPRVSPALKTRYGYDANGLLTSIAPPGLNAWTVTYDGAQQGRVSSVSRPSPQGTLSWSVAYGVALSGSGLPDVSAGTAATGWGQSDTADLPDPNVPGGGTAIFPPGHSPGSGYDGATIRYLDVAGRVVNTASQQAGLGWQVATSEYDGNNNLVRTVSAANRQRMLADFAPNAIGAEILSRHHQSPFATAARMRSASVTASERR